MNKILTLPCELRNRIYSSIIDGIEEVDGEYVNQVLLYQSGSLNRRAFLLVDKRTHQAAFLLSSRQVFNEARPILIDALPFVLDAYPLSLKIWHQDNGVFPVVHECRSLILNARSLGGAWGILRALDIASMFPQLRQLEICTNSSVEDLDKAGIIEHRLRKDRCRLHQLAMLEKVILSDWILDHDRRELQVRVTNSKRLYDEAIEKAIGGIDMPIKEFRRLQKGYLTATLKRSKVDVYDDAMKALEGTLQTQLIAMHSSKALDEVCRCAKPNRGGQPCPNPQPGQNGHFRPQRQRQRQRKRKVLDFQSAQIHHLELKQRGQGEEEREWVVLKTA